MVVVIIEIDYKTLWWWWWWWCDGLVKMVTVGIKIMIMVMN